MAGSNQDFEVPEDFMSANRLMVQRLRNPYCRTPGTRSSFQIETPFPFTGSISLNFNQE